MWLARGAVLLKSGRGRESGIQPFSDRRGDLKAGEGRLLSLYHMIETRELVENISGGSLNRAR